MTEIRGTEATEVTETDEWHIAVIHAVQPDHTWWPDAWTTDVICEEGPTALNSARPLAQAMAAAERDIQGMISGRRPAGQPQVWTLVCGPLKYNQLRQLGPREAVAAVRADPEARRRP